VAVVVPTMLVAWSGLRTGVVRAQDQWTARVVAPAPAVEAWSMSFRRDPPSALTPEAAPASEAAQAPNRDPRPLTLAMAGLAAFLLLRLAPPGARPLVIAGSLLTPAMVVAVVFGSPQPIVLAGAAGAALLARARGEVALGLVAGGLLTALAVAFAAGGPGLSAIGPGLGLFNIFLYWGAEEAAAPLGLVLAATGLAGAAALAWAMKAPAFGVAAAAWLMALWFLPSASPHALAAPLALVALAAVSTDLDSESAPASTDRPPLP
jgi:hypothetical protein